MFYVISIGAAAFAVFFLCIAHVGLTGRRVRALNALSDVDEQLHFAVTLLPGIAELAGGHLGADHTDIDVLKGRRDDALALYNPKDAGAVLRHLTAANMFALAISALFDTLRAAAAEKDGTAGPDGASAIAELQKSMQIYRQIEDGILQALERYNRAAAALNLGVAYFPGSMLAKISGIREMPVFDAAAAETGPGDPEKMHEG